MSDVRADSDRVADDEPMAPDAALREAGAALYADRYQHPMPWATELAPATLVDLFEATAARAPDAAFLDFMGRRYTYADTHRAVRRVAKGLQLRGIGKGARVGLFLPNVPHYPAAYYGAMMAGATVVNFSPLYTVEELAAQVEDSGTELLITLTASALLPKALEVLECSSLKALVAGSVAGVLPTAKSLLFRLFKRDEVTPRPADPRVTGFADLIANDGRPAPVAIDPMRDIALIQYTGGTTGTPKGAMLSHQNLAANARQVNGIDPKAHQGDDRILGVLPFFHVFANTCVLNRTMVNGGEIVMLPRFDAAQALGAITRRKPTSLPGVPTMYQALLDHPACKNTDFSSLRACISGGAPMPAEVRARFEALTGAKVVEGFGLTESAGVVSVNPYEGDIRQGSIGQPLPGTEVRLADKEDPARPAPDGEPGELLVRGPQIMQGYWNRPDADGDSLTHDGWLRTGDVAVIDADGYLTIVDRLKDMISVGGFKVYPSEIERVLYQHDLVKEALVLGAADDRLGERPVAYVTLADGCADDAADAAIRDWTNGRIGKHERLARVVVRDAMPKTMIGKLDRKALRAELAAAPGTVPSGA